MINKTGMALYCRVCNLLGKHKKTHIKKYTKYRQILFTFQRKPNRAR